ncbi:MAG: hypothetical protein Kow001_05370 [Acidobacteriota bacterium]
MESRGLEEFMNNEADRKDLWRRKLLAFVHDPPNKPLDIQGHTEVAGAIRRRAGFGDEEVERFSSVCDHTAAAADRFPFSDPRSSGLKSEFTGDGEHPFHHPLGGAWLTFDRLGGRFQSAAGAEEVFQTVQPGGEGELRQLDESERDWANFFLHWRRWPESAATKDPRTVFLPADTRLPDHSVWTHNSVVSALEACVEDEVLRPAFLLFQLGPVQEFISQARSTRDLWSGSYLLSWLMAHAIKAVTDRIGPDCVLYPALRGQPLFDFLHKERLYDRITYPAGGKGGEDTLWSRLQIDDAHILTPNLPNRFLAVVPEGEGEDLAERADRAVRKELGRIGAAVKAWLKAKVDFHEDWHPRFDRQLELFPRIAWQVLPWPEAPVATLLDHFRALVPEVPDGKNEESADGVCPEQDKFFDAALNLRQLYTLAKAVDPAEMDPRCWQPLESEKELRRGVDREKLELTNRAFCWSYFYALTDWLLAARRRLRDFEPWPDDPKHEGAVKDSLSGVEEVIGSEDWWPQLKDNPQTKFFFRSADRLGAVNLLKRLWHEAYLKEKKGLKVERCVRFDSVPAVAAGRWRSELLEKLRDDQEVWISLRHLRQSMIEHEDELEQENLQVSHEEQERCWLERTDPGCFGTDLWPQDSPVQKVLTTFFEICDTEKPPSYYAVLAFDGDRMGRWVSGAMGPKLADQLSSEARKYFGKVDAALLEQVHRPLSPSYHLQFSEALCNFGLYLAGAVVEHFDGQLIYSGGDDVLAMLPAETALDCAEALVLAFRGDPELEQRVPGMFEVFGERWGKEGVEPAGGFVRFREGKRGRPTWPLIVPGPRASASVGVAFGHVRAPLQGLVRAAQAAEKRAKKELERNACAVSLFKRSGEILHWGFKWDSGALPLYRKFVELSSGGEEKALLSQRFGYALQELLRGYAVPEEEGGKCSGAGRPASGKSRFLEPVEDFPLQEVMKLELEHVLRRQGTRLREKQEELNAFLALCDNYLEAIQKAHKCRMKKQKKQGNEKEGPPWRMLEDFPMLFNTANFIRRGN